MAIYRKNAGAASRFRKASGKKQPTSLRMVTSPVGTKYSIKHEGKFFFKMRDGKKIKKSANSTDDKSKFQYYLTTEQAAFWLARMADPDLGASQVRKGTKFVKDRKAEAKKRTTKKAAGQKNTTTKKKGSSAKTKAGAALQKFRKEAGMKPAKLSSAYLDTTAKRKEALKKLKAKSGGKTKSNPRRRNRRRRLVSFKDLY